ncbi:MAG: DUF1501 domain-containing protein [Chthoniobacteraceae bacterium]
MKPANPNCNDCHPLGVTRRAAIQAGAIGLLGLGMNHVAGLRALGAAAGSAAQMGRAKSVIYIFLSGGLAQHESFDMKPEATLEVRGEFKPIRTSAPGMHICEHLPELAKRAHKFALVRSLTHPSNDHSAAHHIMLTGHSDLPVGFDPTKPKATDYPSIAAVAGRVLPARNNLPPAVVLPEKLRHREGRMLAGQFAGQMGKQHDPWFIEMSPYHPAHYGAYPEYLFHHEKGSASDAGLIYEAPHLSLPQGLSVGRVMDRVSLRGEMERQSHFLDGTVDDPGLDKYRDAAVSLITNGKVHDAFDISRADPKWLDRYGRNSFGWSLLMARQLLEVGVRLVQVNLGNNETWDTHQAAWPNLKNFLLPPMDRAVSALLDDLDSRGLLSETLIVMGGEFGRTPRISKIAGATLPGRDHWGASQTVFLAGGGVRGGTVIGATDRIGAYPSESPQRPENLAATIYQGLGLPRTIEWHDPLDRPHTVYDAEPIPGLT